MSIRHSATLTPWKQSRSLLSLPNPKIYAGTEHEQTVNPQRWHAESPRHVVQQHYVNARTHDINVNQGDRLRSESAALFREFFADRLRGLTGKQKDQYCQDAYQRLTRVLQSRDVTINFKARNWFSRENTYASFAQMYEKAIQANGKMVLDNSDKLNPAMARTATDDSITFPQAWNTAQANQPLHRGLRPGQQSPQRIMGRMMGGKHLMPSMMADIPDDNLTEISPGRYQSPNLRFNPKTKQVFAALNYGRRPHGSSTQYGKSFFILKPSVKVNAIYFAGDTFQVTTGANAQVSYQNLAAVFLKGLPGMRESLRSSCFLGISMEDSDQAHDLLEAHLFHQVKFSEHVSSLNLHLDQEDGDPNAHLAIVRNAQQFCRKWGITFNRCH